MAPSWRVRLLLLILVILLQAGFGGSWAAVYAMRRHALEAFKPHMAEYLAPAKGTADPPAVQGKLIVVDKATQDVDWDVFYGLPDDLRAARPDEVGTVAVLDYAREQDNRFAYGPRRLPAFRQTCTVTVVNLAGRGLVANITLRGGDPPDSIDDNATEGVGPKPWAQVINYLKNLHRQ